MLCKAVPGSRIPQRPHVARLIARSTCHARARSARCGTVPPCAAVANPSWAATTATISEDDKSRTDELVQRFRAADLDGNGRVCKQELRRLLQENSTTRGWLSEQLLDSLMQQYDQDESGDLSAEEFRNLVQDSLLLQGTVQLYREAFDAADSSGNGTLSATELAALLGEIGQPVTYEQLVELMQKYDLNENGQIEFDEFTMMFRDQLFDQPRLCQWLEKHDTEGERTGAVLEVLRGDVSVIFSSAELDDLLTRQPDDLVLLFAGLSWCRPCKGMTRAYQRLADAYPGVVFLKLYGNANANTKELFVEQLKIKSTPAFLFFQQRKLVGSCCGANKERLEQKLRELVPQDAWPKRPVYIRKLQETAAVS